MAQDTGYYGTGRWALGAEHWVPGTEDTGYLAQDTAQCTLSHRTMHTMAEDAWHDGILAQGTRHYIG